MPDTKTRKFRINDLPWATIGIILTNVIITIIASRDFEGSALDYGLMPANVDVGRVISASFLHDGYIHLSINMLLLYFFGRSMEWAMGRLELVLFYVGACLASAIMYVAIIHAALPPYYATRVVVGASGAVAGVMGLYAVRYHRKMIKMGGVEVSALLLIMLWLLMQVGFGVIALYREDFLGLRLRYVAYWSHLGGFAFGIITALIANMALHGEREYLIAEGKRNYDQGNLLEAAQNYETLLRHDPDNAFAYAELGRLWAIMEEEAQSLPHYRKAVKLYIREGHEDLAIKAAAEMKKFWPDFMLSSGERFRLASYLEEMGQPERAILAFEEIFDKSPASNEAQMSLLKAGHLQLASLRKPDATINTLTKFLDCYPESEWKTFAQEMIERAKSGMR
ncbi:MAG: rhomboid family intramembrane serine protease [Armatimonadetes bacterium]|nr:rhomboid family intramembrane serine protease [Armatimonadota bacterium]